MNRLSTLFEHVPHPRTKAHLNGQVAPPAKVRDERVGLNGRVGLLITTAVGTMWAAYLFGLVAFVSLPSAIRTGSSIVIVAWVAQTFLQLVLLPIIIVGQNIQAKASDKRADETFKDAEAVLSECVQIQEHLTAQDVAIQQQLAELKDLLLEVRGRGAAT